MEAKDCLECRNQDIEAIKRILSGCRGVHDDLYSPENALFRIRQIVGEE